MTSHAHPPEAIMGSRMYGVGGGRARGFRRPSAGDTELAVADDVAALAASNSAASAAKQRTAMHHHPHPHHPHHPPPHHPPHHNVPSNVGGGSNHSRGIGGGGSNHSRGVGVGVGGGGSNHHRRRRTSFVKSMTTRIRAARDEHRTSDKRPSVAEDTAYAVADANDIQAAAAAAAAAVEAEEGGGTNLNDDDNEPPTSRPVLAPLPSQRQQQRRRRRSSFSDSVYAVADSAAEFRSRTVDRLRRNSKSVGDLMVMIAPKSANLPSWRWRGDAYEDEDDAETGSKKQREPSWVRVRRSFVDRLYVRAEKSSDDVDDIWNEVIGMGESVRASTDKTRESRCCGCFSPKQSILCKVCAALMLVLLGAGAATLVSVFGFGVGGEASSPPPPQPPDVWQESLEEGRQGPPPAAAPAAPPNATSSTNETALTIGIAIGGVSEGGIVAMNAGKVKEEKGEEEEKGGGEEEKYGAPAGYQFTQDGSGAGGTSSKEQRTGEDGGSTGGQPTLRPTARPSGSPYAEDPADNDSGGGGGGYNETDVLDVFAFDEEWDDVPNATASMGQKEDAVVALLIEALAPLGVPRLEADLTAEGTPSHEALRWLLEKDTAAAQMDQSLLSSSANDGAATVIVERWVLARIYFGMGGEGGGWVRDDGYLTNASVCDWYGVACTDDDDDDGGDSSSRRVEELLLAENGLVGTVPFPELALLERLEVVDLHGNDIVGSLLPEAFASGRLGELKYVDLSGNEGLEGAVPEEMGALSNLEVLFLHDTALTSRMPPSVCDLRSTALADLWADCGGDPPEMECECCTKCFGDR